MRACVNVLNLRRTRSRTCCCCCSDIAPEGSTLAETNAILDDVSDLALELMRQTGIKLLWGTCNLFSHPRYMNGAATNPDAHVVAYAAAAVKKGLEVAKKLGAENYGRWSGTQLPIRPGLKQNA